MAVVDEVHIDIEDVYKPSRIYIDFVKRHMICECPFCREDVLAHTYSVHVYEKHHDYIKENPNSEPIIPHTFTVDKYTRTVVTQRDHKHRKKGNEYTQL